MKWQSWPAGLAVLALLAFAFWHLMTSDQSMDKQAAEQVRFWIKSEYQRYYLSHRPDDPAALTRTLNDIDQLQLTAVTARGGADDTVIQVRVAPLPVEPPGVAHRRFFRMHYSRFGGWQLDGEVSHLNWYLAVF